MKNYVILLDATMKNGNIVIVCDNTVVDFLPFAGKDERSGRMDKDILIQIENLLAKNNIERKNISGVFLTRAGSLTQNRILGAVCLGLQNSLNINAKTLSQEELLSISGISTIKTLSQGI
ncbi:MAG: hypothetical protein LUM44_16680 [Pyrinomonadaceae bacterium]|nr:hypothetical protein [Pyrinomonadaceae bacterium]